MSDEWQKIQLELALRCAGTGAAWTRQRQGTESRMAEGATKSPATECIAALGMLNPPNRRVRTRTHGGMGGAEP